MSKQEKSPALQALEAARANKAMREKNRAISFCHRRPYGDTFIKDSAEFDLFETLCISQGFAQMIKGVYYDTSICTFDINIDANNPSSVKLEKAIRECASASLTQFTVNGDSVGHKKWLDI